MPKIRHLANYNTAGGRIEEKTAWLEGGKYICYYINKKMCRRQIVTMGEIYSGISTSY